MRIIPKKRLVEAEANPLETSDVDLSNDEAYCQAILGAIASESKAYSEYDQILSLEDNVTRKELVNLFHDVLVDVRDEEMKHLAQLTSKISEVPEMKKAYEAGVKEADSGEEQSLDNTENKEDQDKDEVETKDKEEVKESVQVLTEAVQQNRTYDNYTVCQIIADTLGLNDKQYEILEKVFGFYEDEMLADEVDRALIELRNYFNISDSKVDQIENAIIASNDPITDRKNDFKDDIDSDISSIENVMENVYSIAAKEKLFDVIQYLKKLEYNGEKEIGWSVNHSAFGGKNPKKRIIA